MIPDLHARLCPQETLRGARQALYRMAMGFLGTSAPLNDRTADSPLLRHAVHKAMSGGGRVSDADLDRADLFAGSPIHLAAGSARLPLIGGSAANEELVDVRRALVPDQDARLLTVADGERFTHARARLQAGLDLAATHSPLLGDLVPHVALVGLLDEADSGGVHSASLRGYPGLILMSAPASPWEAAEVFLHEAAHQKLFDMIIVLDMLDVGSDACPHYAPPWRAEDTRWPLEQCLAALHAYCCLAAFTDDLGSALDEVEVEVSERSLLPHARERVGLIGQWLVDHSSYLRPDAVTLVGGLLGVEVPQALPTPPPPPVHAATGVAVDPTLRFDTDEQDGPVLVGRPALPPDFYFLGRDSGRLLQLLKRHEEIDSAVLRFTRERGLDGVDADAVVTAALSELVDLRLVSLTGK